MSFKFSAKSLEKLRGVHPKLVECLMKAIKTSKIDFTILEGVRSQQRQTELFKQGKSQRDGVVRKSEHQIKKDGLGYAVDLAPLPIDWNNKQKFIELSNHIKATAKSLGISIIWGGDFKSLVDMPHYELKL